MDTHADTCVADCILSIDVGRKNLGMCCLRPGDDRHGHDDVIEHWIVASTMPECAAVAETMRQVGVPDWLPRVRAVVIERQPGKNVQMVRLQCYLEMYFAMCGCPVVVLQDPKMKLCYAATTPFWPCGVPDAWTYYARKKLAVQTTHTYLHAVTQPLANVFDTSRKKDDLADCLLHGMAYAHMTALAPSPPPAPIPKPRRPSARQLASGKLAKSHVVYLLTKPSVVESEDDVRRRSDECRALRNGIARHFGSVEFCFRALSR